MMECTIYENVKLAFFKMTVISAIFYKSNLNLDVAHLHTMRIAYMKE